MKALDKMLQRKEKIRKLKFQKELEHQKSITTDDWIINSKKIETVRTELLQDLENEIKTLHEDKQIKIFQWINAWIYYLSQEDSFDSSKLRTYKRGDIVHVNFGFNVHNELGGLHYAIVIEADNPAASGCITVIPLRSEDTEQAALESLHEKTEVYLGCGIIGCGNGYTKHTIAKINQIRAIDKMRILNPKKDSNDIIVYPTDSNVRTKILDLIDSKLIELLTKPQKNS